MFHVQGGDGAVLGYYVGETYHGGVYDVLGLPCRYLQRSNDVESYSTEAAGDVLVSRIASLVHIAKIIFDMNALADLEYLPYPHPEGSNECHLNYMNQTYFLRESIQSA